MNNGHTNPQDNLLKFPTPNNVEANDNLDLNNPETSWEQPIPTEHDKKAIGSSALNPVELSMPPSTQEITPPLGEITEHSLQPEAAPKLHDQAQETTTHDIGVIEDSLKPDIVKFVNPESVKEEGGKIPAHVVKAMDQILEGVDRGEISAESIPELKNDLIGEYLHGSFNRKTVLKKTDDKEAA